MNLKLSEHAFAAPLKKFLKLANYNISNFFNQISLKDASISNILLVLRDYKAYDILLPLNILIKISFIEEHLEWWNKLIADIDINNEIHELTEELYQKIINDNKNGYWKNNLYFEYGFSYAQIESYVWQTCFEHFEDIFQEDTNFGLCLFTPGLYISGKKINFWKKLDEKVFPQLIKECQKISVSIVSNHFEVALVKRNVYIYCSELGIFYYNVINNMIDPIISCPKTELEENCSQKLIQVLETATNRMNNTGFYISENFLDQLYLLFKYSEKFQFSDFCCKCLELCLPVLLQCIGKYSKASKKVMNYLSQLSASYRADNILFLSLYITMFTSSNEVKTRIGHTFEEIFNGEYQLDPIIEVFKDIKLFFIKFSNELSMRFDKDGIKQLKEEIDPIFYSIYEYAFGDVSQDQKTGFEKINDAYWLLTNLFGNGKIVSTFETLLANISNEELNYSTRLMCVSKSSQLFFALTSHMETEIRICIRDVCGLVDIPDSVDFKRLYGKNEIFYIYNSTQVEELRVLGGRLKNVYENLPHYSTALLYEKNIVDFIREKLMDSQKQIVGSDFKEILII